MLVLGRTTGERIFIQAGEHKIVITVVPISEHQVLLGFDADAKSVSILREEVWLAMERDRQLAGTRIDAPEEKNVG